MRMCQADTQFFIGLKENMQFQPCSHRARVCIDGIDLCIIHAGRIAIRKLIAMNEAEAIKMEAYTVQSCEYKQ